MSLLRSLLNTKKKQQALDNYNTEVLNITLNSNQHAIANALTKIISNKNVNDLKGLFDAISYITRLQNGNNTYTIDIFKNKFIMQFSDNKLVKLSLLDS